MNLRRSLLKIISGKVTTNINLLTLGLREQGNWYFELPFSFYVIGSCLQDYPSSNLRLNL